MQSQLVQSIRVDDPNDYKAVLMGIVGWRLIDVTFDPLAREWVMTFTIDL